VSAEAPSAMTSLGVEQPPIIEVIPIDLGDPSHVEGLQAMLREYALSPQGGASALQDEALARLPRLLADRAHYVGWLAWLSNPKPVRAGPSLTEPQAMPGPEGSSALAASARQCIGLLNAFEGVSTFRAQPLLNLHDIAVTASWRGRGVGRALMAAAEAYAKARGCCKLTLEVLEGNTRAIGLYRSAGFDPYELDPAMGRALFFEKWID